MDLEPGKGFDPLKQGHFFEGQLPAIHLLPIFEIHDY
jgi:hypothetical protein